MTPIWATPPFGSLQIPHRHFDHLSSNARNSTKTNRNSFKFQNSIDYIKMKSYTEYDIAFAIDETIEGVSIRIAAKNWNIPYNTLRNRIKGYQTHRQAAESQQRLPLELETKLTTWILAQHDLGYPLIHQEIRVFVEHILCRSGDDSKLGKRWIQCFLRRNPVIKVGRSCGIDV